MTINSLFAGPIARATVVSMTIRIAGLVLSMFQAILTARLLGPEGYGTVAYVMSISMILATVALAGTEPLAVREVARFLALKDLGGLNGFMQTIRKVLMGAVVLIALMVVLVFYLTTFGQLQHHDVILFALLLFPLFALATQNQGVLRGFGAVLMAQAPLQIFRPAVLVAVLASVWFVGGGIGTTGYLVAAAIGAGLAVMATQFSLSRRSRDIGAVPTRPQFREVANRAAPLFAGSVLALMLGEINTLMLTWWAGPEETGLFQPIARIAPLFVLGAQAAGVRFAPRVSELWATGENDRLAGIAAKFTVTTTIFTVVVALLIVLFGERILQLFGREFSANSAALLWVAGAQIFDAACGPVGMLLTMSGRAKLVLAPQFAALVVNAVLGWLLISSHGAIGAAIAMSGGIICWNIGGLVAVRSRMDFDPSILRWFLNRASH